MSTSTTHSSSRIQLERLQTDLRELSDIGRNPIDGGLYRMAFTKADMEARHWLEDRIRQLGLEPHMDGAGNISAILPGKDRNLPRILVGSHIDTVPCAGTLDGTLGVLSGLECLRVLKERPQPLLRDIELIAFSDEEGRFGGMLGSQAFVGNITPEYLHQAADLDGQLLSEAMESHGLDPWKVLEARRNPESLAAYLELHIEQGPVLDSNHHNVGLVEAITGLTKWSVSLLGEPNHAGTTPMNMRRDAFMGVADFAHEIPRILAENASELARATIGKIHLTPGSPNTVPGEALFSLDMRDTDLEILRDLANACRKALSAIARRRNLMFEFTEESHIPPVQCKPSLVDILEQNTQKLELSYLRMPSGAAHDAQIIANIAPVAMIFVPSREGRSHAPAEWSAWKDIEAAANVLLLSLGQLADSETI